MDKQVKDDGVVIYTDGACSGNPGPGGWGAVLIFGNNRKELSGAESLTTNNQMELKAAITALKALKRSCQVTIHTDSSYLLNGITTWVKTWQKNNWRNSQKKEVANRALWEELLSVVQKHTIKWVWVKGHNGNPENERCDELARCAIEQQQANTI